MSHKLNTMTSMPITTPMMERCPSPNERETGTSSSSEMKTMIPATPDNIKPRTVSFKEEAA
jgi:hypothetical protein